MKRELFDFGNSIIALIVIALLGLQACDSGTVPDHDSGESVVETIRFVEGDYSIEVILDPDFEQERLTFKDLDSFQDFTDELMERPVITLNADLYRRLIHALHPSEIGALDSYGKVTIDDYEYMATQIGAYRHKMGSLNHTKELVEYWGEDGDAVERELMQLYDLYHRPEELTGLTFKNVFVQETAQRMLQQYAAGKTNNDEPPTITNGNAEYAGYETICLDSSCYSIRFLIFNQSTGKSSFSRKAHASTQAQGQLNGIWYGFGHHLLPHDLTYRVSMFAKAYGGKGSTEVECIGSTGTLVSSGSELPPYPSASGSKSCSSVSTSVKRKKKTGSESWHHGGSGTGPFFPNVYWYFEWKYVP